MSALMHDLPLGRLWKIGRPFWLSEHRKVAYAHLLVILLLMGTNIALQVVNNFVQGRVAQSIQLWNLPDVSYYMLLTLLLVALQTPVQVYTGILRTRLAIIWRKWLSTSFFQRWYDASTKSYFWITTRRKNVANPDQRMTQDPDSFANSTIGLLTTFLEAGAQIVSWAGVLLSLSYVLTVAAVACAAISSAMVILIGKALVGLNSQLLDAEAELRVTAGRARDAAESIAFGHGENVARAQATSRLGAVVQTLMQILRVNRNIQLFTTGWNLVMPLLPPVIMVYMSSGQVDYALIVRAAGAFNAFYSAANVFTNQFAGLASYFAIINRLGVFSEALEWAGDADPQPGKHIEVTIGSEIAFEQVTILTADASKMLLTDVTFRLAAGDSLLICSQLPEAQGKTSLLKTIAGVLNNGSGKMERPAPEEMMFLTPSPDLPTGTLREALSYPSIVQCQDDSRLHQILTTVGLTQISLRLGGLDSEENWKEALSKTEQQRLVLARIVLNRPKYVVIDETGLDEEIERVLYTVLAALGATVVSAGNPATLLTFHNQVLEISASGSCQLFTASAYRSLSPSPSPP